MFHPVTFASDPARATCILGPCRNLADTSATWTGFLDKLRAVKAFAATRPPDDIILFTDAYDAVWCHRRSLDDVRAIFDQCDADIVFSAETNCYPWPERALEYAFDPDSPFMFLNAGGYVGTAKALCALFDALPFDGFACDQGYLTTAFLSKRRRPDLPRMALDSRCRIFQSMYRVPWTLIAVRGGEVVNTMFETTPTVIHFNGSHHLLQEDEEGGGSVLPRLHDAITCGRTCGLDDLGAPLATPAPIPNPARPAVIECARRAAARFRAPSAKATRRDKDNQHAIFQGARSWSPISAAADDHADHAAHFHAEVRDLVQRYLAHVTNPHATPPLLDILLHDFVGIQHVTPEYPHSVLGFSKDVRDAVNICIPDRYAMMGYRGMLDIPDPVPLDSKRNVMLCIGSSTGTLDPATNQRLRVCEFAASREYLRAHISEIVNLDPRDVPAPYLHEPMTIPEQHAFRHLLVVDGNTACWDRLPWILASGSVCWKLDSSHECWYYPLLTPWVHYIPCSLETLDATWALVSQDIELQRRIVRRATEFARTVLSHESHALYTRTLLDTIASNSN